MKNSKVKVGYVPPTISEDDPHSLGGEHGWVWWKVYVEGRQYGRAVPLLATEQASAEFMAEWRKQADNDIADIRAHLKAGEVMVMGDDGNLRWKRVD